MSPLLFALLLAACDSSAGPEGTRDAGIDAAGEGEGEDAAVDAGGCETAPYTGVDGCDVMGQSYLCEGNEHVADGTPITWRSNPPHSGPHYADPTTWGEHEEVVPRETWVANLEAGGIVLLHNCPDPCVRELGILRDVIADRPDRQILMTPDPELAAGRRFAAVAWTWYLSTDDPSASELLCFVDEHEGLMPPHPAN